MMVAGLDIGTTGCKVTVFDSEGRQWFRAYQNYPIRRNLGSHEVDVQAIWEGVCQVLSQVGSQWGKELCGLGVTSFGETFVALDENDQPVAPCMLYTDPRGAEQVEQLTTALGREQLSEETGLAPHSMYSLPKLLWLKDQRPELFQKVCRICLIGDYVAYRLSGVHCIDYSLASRTMAFDVKNLCWSKKVFSAAGIDPSLFGNPVPSGTICGKIRQDLAQKWDLPESLPIVLVSHDQVAAAVGSGALSPGQAVDGAGTVECITPVFNGFPQGKELQVMAQCGFAIVPYIMPNTYVTYAFTYTGGALVQWFLENFAGGEQQKAQLIGKSLYDYIEGQMKDCATGIFVLPHFAGAATPYMDVGSKGAILGLTLEHRIADLYRAVMEGVSYEMKLNTQCLAKGNVQYKSLRATGGGAASRTWLQIKADILGVPVTTLNVSDAGTVGSAMLTGVAVGMFPSLEKAAEAFINLGETYWPRQDRQKEYDKLYAQYQGIYQAVRPFMEDAE